MRSYIIKRLLLTIPMLFAISFIAFVLMSFIPSDPAEVALRVNEVIPTPEAVASMRESLGLNDPFLVRYFEWLYDCLHLEFGTSYIHHNRLVFDEIVRSLPSTLKLAGFAFIVVIAVSLPIGILSAVYQNTWFDRFVRLFMFIFTAIPNYWLGLILMWVFAIYFNCLFANQWSYESFSLYFAIHYTCDDLCFDLYSIDS